VAAAAEAADTAAFVSFLSSDFSDFVHADRASLEAMLRETFDRVDRLNVTLSAIDVVVDGTEAVARFDAVVVAIRGEERYVVLGTPFEGEKLEAALQREPDGWKIRNVSRSPIAP
jgi:malonyl CoA-acyl carrier protein transacylase